MFDVHTTDQPVRHFGCYEDAAFAERMRQHLSQVLQVSLVVEPVDVEPWLTRLGYAASVGIRAAVDPAKGAV